MKIGPESKWRGSTVWDCERCCVIPAVLWVNSETLEYCTVDQPARAIGDQIVTTTHQAKKIEWLFPSKLILINPVEGIDGESIETTAVLPPIPTTTKERETA